MPQPFTFYPDNSAASTTLATANPLFSKLAAAPASLSQHVLIGTATGFGEIWSQNNVGAWAAGALNTTIAPTGHGWFLDSPQLDGFTLLSGLWTVQARLATSANTCTIDLYYRVFVYDPVALTYTLVGVVSALGNAVTTTTTSFPFSAQSLPSARVPVGNRIYVDLWGNITASTMVSGNTLFNSQSSQTDGGSPNIFLTSPGVIPSYYPRYTGRAFGGTIIPEPVKQPLPYIGRALGSTVVYENRTFVPRALGGVYMPDTVMWVPRALVGTEQVALLRPLTLAGVGTLTGTLSVSSGVSLTAECDGVGTLTGALAAAPLFQSVVKNTLMNMHTFGWNAGAATKQHSGGYTLNTGGLYINWESAINWASYDIYFDVNQSSPDANTLLHGLLQSASHDAQTCLQYLRSVALYKTAFPSDTSFDSANASGFMSVSAFTDHVTTDFAPQYTSGVYGGYSNPNGWVYWALLDCYLNLQGTGLLTPTQVTNLQQSCLYAAFTFNTAWLEPTTGMFCETNANTYRPNNSLMMAAAVLDACKRWPGQITTGMFYYSGAPTQSVAIWQANALSTINAVLTRGAYNTTYNVFVDAMNLVIGGTDTVNDDGCKASLIGETALALTMLYGLTGTASYLTRANTLLRSIDSYLLDATNGGYYFSFNTSTGTTSTNSKESRATAHILRAYHYYNAYTSTYSTNEANILTTLLTKFYKLVGGTGYNYRVKPDATFGSYTDSYSPSYTSTLAAAVAINDTGVQVNDWPSASTTTSTDAIAAGVNTVTPASMAGIGVGDHLLITGGGGTAENITVTSKTSTTYTATYVQTRTGTWTIDVTFPDIVMCLDINATHEEEIVLSAYGTTGAAAPFTIPVNTAANGTGQFLKTHALSAPIQTVFMPITNVETTYTTEAMGGVLVDELATVTPIVTPLFGVSQPLPYIGRALGSTIVYENRTFIPRALSGVYIPDTILPVPRALLSTIQATVGLGCILPGIGTLSATLSTTGGVSLTDTIPGVGTLTGTLSANTALSDTLAGVGTLTGTLSLSTALSTTLAGVGTLAAAFTLATSLSVTDAGIGTLTPTLSANLALPSVTLAGAGTLAGSLFAVSQPLPYIGRGLFSTIIYENRTFVPRALAGVYIPDTILPVPRALLSTIQATVGLGCTLAGVGTLTETFTLATALTTTLAGVGTLTGTLSEATALTTTLAGVGQLLPTLSTTGGVSLTCTMAGVGTLSGTLSLATSLTDTLAGVGTLTAALSLTTALSTSAAGIGTLSGTLSANLTFASVTMAGVGTLAATMSAQAILSTSLVGVGTLSGVYSLRVALSLTFAGIGTLAGTITIPSLSFLSAMCVTRDMLAVARTRDMQATCTTRDERASALQRDMQATALTRDEQATAKTRS